MKSLKAFFFAFVLGPQAKPSLNLGGVAGGVRGRLIHGIVDSIVFFFLGWIGMYTIYKYWILVGYILDIGYSLDGYWLDGDMK